MEVIGKWVNQKTANFLRDYKKEPEPEDIPNPTCRGGSRLLFLVVLSVAFALSLAFLMTNGPNVRLVLLTNLGTNKSQEYVCRNVYNRSNQYDTEREDIVRCPCNTTRFSWKEFTKVYILNENSTDWNITYNPTPTISITVPSFNDTSPYNLSAHIQRNQTPVTSTTFCKLASLWPVNNCTDAFNVKACNFICEQMSSTLLVSQQYPDFNNTSEVFLESPILLGYQAVQELVFYGARELLLRTGEILRFSAGLDKTANTYIDAMTVFFINVLETIDGAEWKSYASGAKYQSSSIEDQKTFHSSNPEVLVLNNSAGIAFLHMEVNWTRYYEKCNPQYCEKSTPMTPFRRVYWGFALLGGVATVVLGIVNILLWPALAFVLNKWGSKTTTENENSGLLPPGERSHDTVFMSSTTGSSPQQTPQRTKSTRSLDRMVSRGREAHGPEDL